MKRPIKLILFALVLSPFMVSNAFAQRPFERLQRGWDDIRPRGKILREIFGEDDDDKEAERKQKADLERRLQIQRQQAASRQRDSRGQIYSRSPRTGQPTAANPSRDYNRSRSSQRPKPAAKPKHPSKLDMKVKESKKPEGLTVSKVGSKGAAYLAGIRQGDVVTAIGGMPVSVKEDLEGITEVMKDGDQIEFEISRRGKKQTMMVQFGDPPESESEEVVSSKNRGSATDYSRAPSAAPRLDASIQSVLKEGQSSSRVPRIPSPNSSRDLNKDWQVPPPNASGSRTLPPIRSAGSRPSMNGSTEARLREMTRRLEQQQREIEILRRQLQEQLENQNGSGASDPLLDFDK